MCCLGFLVLIGSIAAAYADMTNIGAEHKLLPHHCQMVAAKRFVVEGKEIPLYQCISESGSHFVLAAESNQDTLDTVISADALVKLGELARPKRQFGGFGVGGAAANAQAFSGGFGAGYENSGYSEVPISYNGGYGGGYGEASAQASALGYGAGLFG